VIRLLGSACSVLAFGVLMLAACQAAHRLPPNEDAINLAGMMCLYASLACFLILCLARARRYWRELLLLGLSMAAALAVVDVALARLRPEFTCMPYTQLRCNELHHRLPPNMTQYMTSENGIVFATTNEDGLRTEYSREQFLAHPTRVAILGDSFTYGVLVPGDKTFSAVTEALLREQMKTPDIAVLNAGIVSYSPFVENLLFEKTIRAYKPGLVLLFLDVTDFGDDYWYQKTAVTTPEGIRFNRKPEIFIPHYCALQELTRPFSDAVLRYAHFPLQLWRMRSQSWTPDEEFEVLIDGRSETNRYFIYRHPLEKTRPYLETTMANIDRLAAQAAAAGAKFAVFVYPRFHLWNKQESPNAWDKKLYGLPAPYESDYLRYFDEIKASKPYPVINMLPLFQETTEFPLCFEADAHWNPKGHRFVARFLADYLTQQEMLSNLKK